MAVDMNFVKRAGLSLGGRRARTAALLGVFAVICVLLLGGFLLQDASARQQADAQRAVGVDVTVGRKGLTPDLVDRLGVPGLVHRYTSDLPVRAEPRGFAPLTSTSQPPKPNAPKPKGPKPEPPKPNAPQPEPPAPKAPEPKAPESDRHREQEQERGSLTVHGVRDLGLLLPFSYGSTRITSGRGITPADSHDSHDSHSADVAVIERRLAERNHLAVGDTVRLRSADGTRTVSLRVIGVFRDPAQDPTRRVPSHELPGNVLYVPTTTARGLGTGPATVDRAVYRVDAPDRAGQLRAEAERVLGRGGFDFMVNDKAYRDQVRPIQRVGAFARLIVQVIAVAGALILGLLVTLQIRERRGELGVLLSLGERKWKLVGQHAVEVAAVALPAVALATLAGVLAGQRVADAFLDHRADSRHTGTRRTAEGTGTALAPPAVRVRPADVGKVAGIGLGISLAATVVPGIGILRLHPRSLLVDSD
jgi:putative ABC transport system permease protein